jgi:hypothetical protein
MTSLRCKVGYFYAWRADYVTATRTRHDLSPMAIPPQRMKDISSMNPQFLLKPHQYLNVLKYSHCNFGGRNTRVIWSVLQSPHDLTFCSSFKEKTLSCISNENRS